MSVDSAVDGKEFASEEIQNLEMCIGLRVSRVQVTVEATTTSAYYESGLYRATMDADLLPDLYTLLRGSVNHQLHLATKGSDGKLHMPVMKSPEYPLPSLGGDTNYQLALTKWGLRYVRQLSSQHSHKSLKREAAAQNYHRHLQDAGVPGPEAGGVRRGAEGAGGRARQQRADRQGRRADDLEGHGFYDFAPSLLAHDWL